LEHSDAIERAPDRVGAGKRKGRTMSVERSLRLVAGAFVLLSTVLGIWVHPAFLWFTLFVGANLLQSSVTNWCPMMAILRKAGVQG
jgi:hypothetical protein